MSPGSSTESSYWVEGKPRKKPQPAYIRNNLNKQLAEKWIECAGDQDIWLRPPLFQNLQELQHHILGATEFIPVDMLECARIKNSGLLLKTTSLNQQLEDIHVIRIDKKLL
ncbi:hypothetical protein ANN_00929 [Periplaneta americana]|uniref:Uncharacterized protein n=1 Tax=Periplaneta americana TaxID=6978 RepID=A0ABQ8TT95_PERAM|nr:hypothetical protein ANN_00929 [Periplaneta americana]